MGSNSISTFSLVIGLASGMITIVGLIIGFIRFHCTKLPRVQLRALTRDLEEAQQAYLEWCNTGPESAIRRILSEDLTRIKSDREHHTMKVDGRSAFSQYWSYILGISLSIGRTIEKARALRSKIVGYLEALPCHSQDLAEAPRSYTLARSSCTISSTSITRPATPHRSADEDSLLIPLPPSPQSDAEVHDTRPGSKPFPVDDRMVNNEFATVQQDVPSGISNSLSLSGGELHRRSLPVGIVSDPGPVSNPSSKGVWRQMLNEALQQHGLTLQAVTFTIDPSGPDHNRVWAVEATINLGNGNHRRGAGEALQKDRAKDLACKQLYESLRPPPPKSTPPPVPA